MRAILSGELGAVSLFDLCQFLMLNRQSGELVIERGGKRVFVFFDAGQIVNAIDDGLNDGPPAAQRILLLTDGAFQFREGAVSPSRRIEVSTENLLLDVARQVDELAEQAGLERPPPGQLGADLSRAALFQLKQRQARELEDLFRSVAGGVVEPSASEATGRFEDALRAGRAASASVHYREESGGAVLLGAAGEPLAKGAVRVGVEPAAARGFLRRALGALARRRLARGEPVSGRFESEGAHFHLSAWIRDGALGIDATELRAEVPAIRPESFLEDLVREASSQEAGAIFLAVPPRCGATTIAAAAVARLLAAEPGRYLVVEERPRYRLAAPAAVCDRWGMEEAPGGAAGLTALAARTGAALVVVDAVRDHRWLRAVLETSRARFRVLATLAGSGSAAAVRSLLGGADDDERRALLTLLAETTRVFFGAVPQEGSSPPAYAHEKIWCSLEAQGLLGSGDLEGFEIHCSETGRADVRPMSPAAT